MASKRKTSRLKSIPVPEAPTHTETLAMCDRLLAYMETRSHSDYYVPYVNSLHKFINNEQYNAKQQTQVTDFFMEYICVCTKLYVVLSNESENKSHKLCS